MTATTAAAFEDSLYAENYAWVDQLLNEKFHVYALTLENCDEYLHNGLCQAMLSEPAPADLPAIQDQAPPAPALVSVLGKRFCEDPDADARPTKRRRIDPSPMSMPMSNPRKRVRSESVCEDPNPRPTKRMRLA